MTVESRLARADDLDHRRGGLATALMRPVVDPGERLGVDRLELLSSDAGRRLYEALGFAPRTAGHVWMQLSRPATPRHP